ncbi:hypothetical protein D3C71_1879220 [compost metagenome]
MRINLFEVCQLHGRHMAHGFQRAMATAALAVTPGNGSGPVRRPQRLGQDGFNAGDELLGALDQMVKFLIHFGL